MRRLYVLPAVLAGALGSAQAEPATCQVIDLEFMPAASHREPAFAFDVQMVAWLETPQGQFVDTVYITQAVGTFGLGNRPGRFDFCSGPDWPYGRRTTTFPVWSHKHGIEFPQVEFQNGNDSALSHASTRSSNELHYCRPLKREEPQWDARTCASLAHTDKGALGPRPSRYPPRSDLVVMQEDDATSVGMYRVLNPFDAISRATPPANTVAAVSWPAPNGLPPGDYVLWVEVAREFDHNATYSEARRPRPEVAFGDYGAPYLGQPSVLYKLPIEVSAGESFATTADYAGYGDPDGLDGNIRPPDATINTSTPGSGALRLGLISANGEMYRIRAHSYPETDGIPPGIPRKLGVVDVTQTTARLEFIAPGDDGNLGNVTQYEVRMLVGGTVTEDNFDAAIPLAVTIPVSAAGVVQTFDLHALLPDTSYSIGLRAFDNCRNKSKVATVELTTLERKVGQVDACFVATAAYGSAMANDVEQLRGFRDRVLRQSVLGELAVSAYYTIGPVLAGAIGESELLRSSARGFLRPIVERLRRMK
ncbi:MAG: hypothetical protein KIT31_30385 [Deltaproteobacteria bacterium]|nr:hypothetical protein [Deltaproteobacteria bacterium]